MHPIRTFRAFKTFCLDTLTAIRELAEAIRQYTQHVSAFHKDVADIRIAVSYLHRAERHERESHGQKVNV